MNIATDTPRSNRIAVFIDFDNVEIGVKSTIGGQFDVGLVLEAIKERGEIVTKIAYSDWKRAGDYSRILTQHAIRMVQRSFTPGGDKNGADITMALDALEMAFTHDHINAFVIVGGDSDFISLVEKLKQYGRKVIVVGGRQFTSLTMQKNCHEFIAYENLVNINRPARPADRGGKQPKGGSEIAQALPLVKRALKVLSDREVTPQLGLLKSTLLQLDSTFNERNFGASSFRDFMEKVADTGAVTLRHAGRSMLVEPNDDVLATVTGSTPAAAAAALAAAAEAAEPETQAAPALRAEGDEEDETLPKAPMSLQDGIHAVQQAFSQGNPRWPMYVRQAKQFLRNAIENFDERKYGFASVVDLLRAAGKEGVLRIERDRQGAVRVFPGTNLTGKPVTSMAAEPVDHDEAVVDTQAVDVETTGEPDAAPVEPIDLDADQDTVATEVEPVAETPILEADLETDEELEEDEVNGNIAGVETHIPPNLKPKPAGRKRKSAGPRGAGGAGPRGSRAPKGPRAAKGAKPRARKGAKG